MKMLSQMIFLLCIFLTQSVAQTDADTLDLNMPPQELAYDELKAKIQGIFNQTVFRTPDYYEKIIPYALHLVDLSVAKHGNKDYNYAMDLNTLADLYQFQGNFDKSIQIQKQVLEIIEQVRGKEDIDYARVLIYVALNYQFKGDYKAIDDYLKQVEPLLPKLLQPNEIDYHIQLYSVASLYEYVGQYSKAAFYYQEMASFYRESGLEQNAIYPEVLEASGKALLQVGDYPKAKAILDEALEKKLEIYGDKNESYYQTLSAIANYHYLTHKYEQSIELLKVIISFRSANKDINYAINLSSLALNYMENGNYVEAIPLLKEALAIKAQLRGEGSQEHLKTLSNYAATLASAGQFNEAIPILEEAKKLVDQNISKAHPEYHTIINNLGNFYTIAGDYDSALPLYIKAQEEVGKYLGKKTMAYARCTNNLGDVYMYLGDYAKADSFFKEAKAIWELVRGDQSYEYSVALHNLAGIESYQGNFKKAIELSEQATGLFRSTKGENSPEYLVQINGLASAYVLDGQFEKAIELYAHALKLAEKSVGKTHQNYYLLLNNLGRCYQEKGALDTAEAYYLKTRELGKLLFSEHHPERTQNLAGLASVYDKQDKIEKATEIYRSLLRLYLQQFKTYYAVLSERGKLLYYEKVKADLYILLSFFQRHPPENEKESKKLFEFSAQMKNLGLVHSIDARLTLANTSDSTLQLYIASWRLLRYQYTDAVLNPNNHKSTNLDSMLNQIDTYETLIIDRAPELGREIASWKKAVEVETIIRSLQPEVTLINFTAFQYHDGKAWTEDIHYTADIIKAGMKKPKTVFICKEKPLAKALGSAVSTHAIDSRAGQQVFNLIWKPLENHLSKTKTVIISATGLLNRVAFAGLPSADKSSKYLIDQYDIEYRDSFRDFRILDQSNAVKDFLLMGNIDYGQDADGKAFFSPLPGTQAEMEAIGKILIRAKIPYTGIDSIYATEQAFKEQCGIKKYDVIHVPTHGGFYPSDTKLYNNTDISMRYRLVQTGNPLLRSFLVFAGINRNWSNKAPENAENDGLLTAYEIANLDLTNRPLVILPACDSGNGDLHFAEGVQGIRYGFKIAGAEALIVSLWKVDDVFSSKFMPYFYDSYVRHQSAEQALKDAVEKIRQEYENPFYWAGFILSQ